MTPEQRIAELEAKLAQVQSEENNGNDPELLAKAKERARMSWVDITWAFEYFGLDTQLGDPDIKLLFEELTQRKYDTLAGTNKGRMARVSSN